MHFERRPEHRRPLLDSSQAVVVGVYGGGIETHAIVPDHQVNAVAAKSPAHGDLFSGGVALHEQLPPTDSEGTEPHSSASCAKESLAGCGVGIRPDFSFQATAHHVSSHIKVVVHL